MAIPFTQYLMPDGRQKQVTIERPPEVEEQAQRIIAAGLCFECEMLGDYRTVSLTVTDPVGDEGQPIDVDCELAANGPGVLAAVDTLVARVAGMVAARHG